MKKQKTPVVEVEDGVKKVLEVLLAEQSKYKSSIPRHFEGGSVLLSAKERGVFDGQFGRDEVTSYLDRADQLGYLERAAFHTRIGCRSGMLVGYRIKEDKVEEVRKLVTGEK